MKKRENFPQRNLGDFFRGGRIQGDVCGGDCWEIKDQIGEKKFQGARNFRGGTFWGNAKKGWENFFGECWGSCEPPKILGGNFLQNVKEKNLGGKFWG